MATACIFLLATKTARMTNHTFTTNIRPRPTALPPIHRDWIYLVGTSADSATSECSMLSRAAFVHNPQFWSLLYFQLTFIVRVFWCGLEFDVTHCCRSHTVTNYWTQLLISKFLLNIAKFNFNWNYLTTVSKSLPHHINKKICLTIHARITHNFIKYKDQCI
jgi:hypothetical protein